MKGRLAVILAAALAVGNSGCTPAILWACKRPEVTAVSLNPCDGDRCGKESGIPFYLPKPLLIVAKNFRNLEEAKNGLTDSAPIPTAFDDQSKYADLNARTNFAGLNTPLAATPNPPAQDPNQSANPAPSVSTAEKSAPTLHSAHGPPISPREAPSDGLAPNTFYTYQIVFVPDMSQRYGLKIRGGPGELRAAMNLVNGWQFTGIGPFYMKDSATAQNILAQGISARLGGQAAADILHATADLAKTAGSLQSTVPADSKSVQELSRVIGELPAGRVPMTIPNFAEIHVYEPHLCSDGRMEWTEIVNLCFNREYLGTDQVNVKTTPVPPQAPKTLGQGGGGQPLQSAVVDPSVARTAVAAVFGVPPDSPALTGPSTLQSNVPGAPPGAGYPAGGVNQVQVACGDDCKPRREFNLFKIGCGKPEPPRARIQNRVLTAGGGVGAPAYYGPPTAGAGMPLQSAVPGAPTAGQPLVNQTFNQNVVPALPSIPPIPPAILDNGGGMKP